ncbi:hypothetical protein [Epilithonimonas arachidiradicis]|uniref:LPXTG cell wall anchor domain-containing protein n=1 Tax=Epilithonimonas arachidiradicis TaxID=1617282 RepID=A0A420DBN7_9FLAO|nr:hypothetical protein [Epilithonimonas arachidiradicis]RKE88998.1 hypothetical protein BXY58_1132 [Epilithonimonas arachidiradicis]GGG53368.1 hypothetical protein GCM10007332_13800 [Epilithonimonas arachidiradicis]
MKKKFLITFLCLGVLSSAQFKDNAFDNESSKLNQDKVQDLNTAEANQNATFEEEQGSPASAGPVGGEQPEGPGNPGNPVPINGLVPLLFLSGLTLIFYYQRKSKKINI